MYKVVIIDDEPVIVEGLSKIMPWGEWDCQVIGTAFNGNEGLELIRKQKPNIVISDISMPQMDGLQMIAAIKSEFSDIQITILTGFREFDYAQKAIGLGVSRFLLKPSRMDELKEAIEAMTQDLMAKGITPEEQNETEAEEVICSSNASSFVVNNALEYIRANYKEKLRLIDVAEQIYVSQWHLSKLLNKYTGQTFSDILNGIRMEKAKELLTDPSLRIYDIALEVGFQDMAHFSRVFKRLEGISANEYRNHLK